MEAAGVEREGTDTPCDSVTDFSTSIAIESRAECRRVAPPRNGPLQVVAPVDPIEAELDRAVNAWRTGRDPRQLRRALLRAMNLLDETE